MTARFQRYAIYWTPELGSDLALFGERWFREPAEMSGLRTDLAYRCVKAPARYGLHATLKAPFPLRPGASAETCNKPSMHSAPSGARRPGAL